MLTTRDSFNLLFLSDDRDSFIFHRSLPTKFYENSSDVFVSINSEGEMCRTTTLFDET